MSETERDSGWSEQYAETGGWPPPAEGQRRYGPGTPPADPSADPPQPAEADLGHTDGPAVGDDNAPGSGGQPTDQAGSAQPGQTAGGYGAPRPSGQPADQAGGYPQPGQIAGDHGPPAPWGQPADQSGSVQPGQAAGGYGGPGPWSQSDPAGGQTGPWGQPPTGPWGPQPEQAGYAQPDQADQWGRPADQPGGWPDQTAYGQPPESWAPGDSAYGRLGRQNPSPPPQQRPRRPWDGRPAPARRPGPPAGTPVVTITLIAICVVLYIVQQANPGFTARYALIPFAVEQGQYARLITSAFLHASLLHLGTNMLTLYIVGAPLERVLRPVRYLIVYFLSALGGSLFSVWLSPEFSIGVGASGAIFGLFGALVVLRRQIGAEAGALAVLIGLNLVISFTVPNISWQAHIGGLITGALVALAMQTVDRLTRRRSAT